jgi:drug/metabolite transporter (DMT)-like permease
MSNYAPYVSLGTALATVSIAQLLFKSRLMRLNDAAVKLSLIEMLCAAMADPLIWLGAIILLVGVCCWYFAMIELPLSLMLPMSSVVTPIVSISAVLLFGENLTLAKLTAILVILVGVAWLGYLNA